MTLYDLVPGAAYDVIADLTHHAGTVKRGERLTFRERAFLPYHGGHTVTFEEATLYLQEDEHRAIIDHLDEYLRPRGTQAS